MPRATKDSRPSQKRKGAAASDNCPACGVPWTDHLGIAGTCRKLEEARGALKVICTWASFRGGECLTPQDTEKLCQKALDASKPNELYDRRH
jgi:hypothetical protein